MGPNQNDTRKRNFGQHSFDLGKFGFERSVLCGIGRGRFLSTFPFRFGGAELVGSRGLATRGHTDSGAECSVSDDPPIHPPDTTG